MGSKILIALLWICFIGFSSADYLSLDGSEWTTTCQNKSITAKAIVPGTVYSDLSRARVLKEDILYGYNDVNYRWVSKDNWTYERTFEVNSTLLSKQVVNLVANGIDTVSDIYINDKHIGRTINQFVRYKFNAKNALKSGKNTIRVKFESALSYSSNQWHWFNNKYHYDIIPDCMAKEYHGECHWNMIRKMASSYSWDWGPAFPTQGIWKPIGIEAYNKAVIKDITVETNPLKNSSSDWTLKIKTFVESDSRKEFEGLFSIDLDNHSLLSNKSYDLKPKSDGTVEIDFHFSVNKIIAWFPNGVADNTQKLYRLKVKLTFVDNKEVSEQTKRIGFRKIELIQTPIKPSGLTFYFQVNSVPFYAKGTNWIPANNLQELITREYLRDLMEAAKRANMNMMRIWGGGVYESDYLYELADEFGIMIWQDFMFACSLYPADPDFLATVDEEVVTQVRRLQHHPSIALWAGNNENEGWVRLGKKADTPHHMTDYVELYINHIRKLVLREDNTRPFVGSSPSNGDEEVKENWTAKNSGDLRYGDYHHYDYSAPLWDPIRYPSGKFASEYGYISYASLETMSTALNDSAFTFPIDAAMEHRQHHPGGTKSIEKEIGYYFRLPSKGGKERFNDLIYLSQIIQAMAMKVETEFYRRNREINPKDGHGMTMGALYWQLNDIWQGPTWASIEFGGKWKLLQSYAIEFFKTQIVTPFEDKTNQTLKIALVRDDYSGKKDLDLHIRVYKWSTTKPVKELVVKVHSPKGFSSQVVWTESIPKLLSDSKCADKSECLVRIDVPAYNATNFQLLSEPKNSKIVKPNLKLVSVIKRSKKENNKNVFDITLSTEAVAPFVALDFKLKSGIRGNFIENGFFIFDPKKTIRFETKSEVTEQRIRDNLLFKTVTDVVSDN